MPTHLSQTPTAMSPAPNSTRFAPPVRSGARCRFSNTLSAARSCLYVKPFAAGGDAALEATTAPVRRFGGVARLDIRAGCGATQLRFIGEHLTTTESQLHLKPRGCGCTVSRSMCVITPRRRENILDTIRHRSYAVASLGWPRTFPLARDFWHKSKFNVPRVPGVPGRRSTGTRSSELPRTAPLGTPGTCVTLEP